MNFSILLADENIWTVVLYMISGFFISKLCQKGSRINEIRGGNLACWNRYYIMAWIWLILIATVRNATVGSDMATFYADYYKGKTTLQYDWGRFFSFHQYEPGFQLWFFLLRKVSANYRFMYLCTYTFVAYAYISFIKKIFRSQDGIIFIQIFFFYFTGNMSGVRAAMGMSFVILSLVALNEYKYAKAIILTLFGMMFHYTMLYNFYIIICYWFFNNINIIHKKFWWAVGFLISMGVSILSLSLVQRILAGTKYSFYFVDISELSFMGSSIYVILAIACIYNYYQVKDREEEAKTALLVSMSFLLTYPITFLLGAYRIPFYYVLPRLKVWSKLQYILEEKFTQQSRFAIKVSMQLIIWLYLLLRYSKSMRDGHFAYHIF